jgi:hypothetical protein
VLCAQVRKEAVAVRTEVVPEVDGVLNDECWRKAQVTGDFIQYGPYNGKLPSQQTRVMFLYDDFALYVGIMLYDTAPDSIYRELGKRDGLETLNADLISVDILPYNDGLNMFEFKVSASGVVGDTKYSPLGQYPAWDAVWDARVNVVDSGWVAEIRIPFSALRFPDVPEQVWGLNLWRSVKRNGEWSTWSFVDKSQSNVLAEYGTLTGLKNLKPGLRLALYPYVSAYAEKFPGDSRMSFIPNGGMDLKLGLSESFTLDATLIPDFGQVESDDKVLNLTPFEIKYNEKRQFFVEGTELFSKCGLFYSRRIGSQPRHYYNVYDNTNSNEIVAANPESTRLINATKISGRTRSGLGIGIFNAMTSHTQATLKDTVSGETRKISTQPFTNYNLVVIDQNLANNSYFTLVNSNVTIPGDSFAANVSGTEFKLGNKKNSYALTGGANMSFLPALHPGEQTGFMYRLGLNKTSGAFRFEAERYSCDHRYNPNDMGYLQNNNEVRNELELSHQMLKPRGMFLGMVQSLEVNHTTLFKGNHFVQLTADAMSYATFKNFMTARINFSMSPVEMNDYYEARYPGYKFIRSGYWLAGFGYGTDNKRKVTFEAECSFMMTGDKVQREISAAIGPRVRFSDRFQVAYSLEQNRSDDEYGYLRTTQLDPTFFPGIIEFCKRDVTTTVNLISAQYIFNPRSSLTLRTRHYWSKAVISEVAVLNTEGRLENFTKYEGEDINFNIFNTDLQYTWNFAPGSELSVVWKNVILQSGTVAETSYYNNFRNMSREPQGNSISVKLLYYLDYKMIVAGRSARS